MRKLTAIAFLFIFLLNVVGCYGIFWIMFKHANIAMIQRLDANAYAEDETVLIKVPLGLPYATDDEDYKRIDGSFQYKGEFYKLVKQKMQQDTLFVVCIKDKQEKEIFDLMSDFVKVNHDASPTSKTMKLLTSFIKEFERTSLTAIVVTNRWSQDQTFCERQLLNSSPSLIIPSPPPKTTIQA